MQSPTTVATPYVASPLRLAPFRALMLAPHRVGQGSLGRTFARPHPDVRALMARWRRSGELTRASDPALYLHEYSAGGMTVRGLVGALDVSRRATAPADRAVFPHEAVDLSQADELADRMGAMSLQPAPILLVHRGPAQLRILLDRIAQTPPAHVFPDRREQFHRIWEITAADQLSTLADALANERALIADGHHRYAAYLRLQERAQGGASDYGLAMLVDQGSTPLFLGAIHRLVEGASLEDLAQAVTALGGRFEPLPRAQALRRLGPGALVATDSRRWAVLHIGLPIDHAAIETVHDQLLPGLPRGPRRITYHHRVEDAVARAVPGDSTALLVPAPDVDLLLRVVLSGQLLPEKATSFQPKPSMGVLMRSLDESDDHHSPRPPLSRLAPRRP